MAKGKSETTAAAEAPQAEKKGAGIVLPNGARRIDFIRDRYYNDKKTRSEIRDEINEVYKNAGEDKKIAYQIVFAATKTEGDPRLVEKPAKEKKEDQQAASA